jgi:hypothetical protein
MRLPTTPLDDRFGRLDVETTGALRVSIVIDNFNYERFLRCSIDSALAQTYPNTEVVVVDDASSDGSRDVIRSYGSSVTPVFPEKNGGQGAAMNAGFAASTGDVVLFLDSDDWLYPRAVERVAAAFASSRGAAIVQYRLHLVDAAGVIEDLYPAPEITLDSGDVVPHLLLTGRYENTVTSGNAFARACLEKVMPIPASDFRIAADGYLVTTAPFFGEVVTIDDPLGAYRQHGSNHFGPPATTDSIALGKSLRRLLDHDAAKYRALTARAMQLGLRADSRPGLREPQHLTSRIASLCVDPERHPYRADRRLLLSLRGALAVRRARVGWRRRAVLGAWFLSVGILPRRLATSAVAWRLSSRFRPGGIRRALKLVRWASR